MSFITSQLAPSAPLAPDETRKPQSGRPPPLRYDGLRLRFDCSWEWRDRMRRRQFVRLLGGAAAAWPHGARPQESVARIGVLMPSGEDDPANRAMVAAFEQGLAQRGWTSGRNLKIDYRWAIDSTDNTNAAVAELRE